MEHGLKTVEVYVKGPGAGREAAIRSLQTAGLDITMIKDVTPIVEQTIIGNRLTSFTIKSRREVDFRTVGFYTPEFRNKDGELHEKNEELNKKFDEFMTKVSEFYLELTEAGIPAEDARADDTAATGPGVGHVQRILRPEHGRGVGGGCRAAYLRGL